MRRRDRDSRRSGEASAARDQTITSKVARINHDYTFGPSALNHFTAGLLRYQNPDGVPDRGFDPQSQLGLNGTLLSGWFPRFSFGLSDIGTNQLKHLYHTVPSVTDSFSKVINSHTIKFGVEYRKALANFFGANGAYGYLTFQTAQTALPYLVTDASIYSKIGSPFASFLLGTVGSAGLNSAVHMSYRSSDYAFFIQDDYKITPRLTVNYGLRYDLHRPLTEKYDRISSFAADIPNPGAGGRPGALGFLGSGSGRVGRDSWLDPDYRDFGPRVGAAFKVNSKTVLRLRRGLRAIRDQYVRSDSVHGLGQRHDVLSEYRSGDAVSVWVGQRLSGSQRAAAGARSDAAEQPRH